MKEANWMILKNGKRTFSGQQKSRQKREDCGVGTSKPGNLSIPHASNDHSTKRLVDKGKFSWIKKAKVDSSSSSPSSDDGYGNGEDFGSWVLQ
ncbi:hypothetical protein QYF36_024416 [Acer negundo]|nr:hypothetical protein QYF36_024416 [Acer negundo]